MKKILSCFLILAMLLSLCACGSKEAAPQDSADTQQEQTPDPENANNQEDDTDETDQGDEAAGLWRMTYYVDNFGQPTDEGFVGSTTNFAGKFSNSATNDSLLYVYVTVDTGKAAFFLYEYGYSQVKNSSSKYTDKYNITMRMADGTEYKFSGTMYCGGDRVVVEDAYYDTVVQALSQEGNVTTAFYIEDAERTTTNYLFSLVSGNFAEEYQKLG